MTLSTLMYYTGFDPYTGKKVYVARRPEDKKRQKEYFFWYKAGDRKQPMGIRKSLTGKHRKNETGA